MEAVARPINVENLRATGRLAEKQVNMALEQAELTGEVIPEGVMNLIKVFKDDATREAVYKAPDKPALQKILNDNGVPMDEEDVDGLLAAIGKAGEKLIQSDGKLTEEELEHISGGSWLSDAWNSVKSGVKKAWDYCTSTAVGKIITGAVLGLVIGAAVGAVLLSGVGLGMAIAAGSYAVGSTVGMCAAAGSSLGIVGAIIGGCATYSAVENGQV